ncbi:hypothetical protein Aspvir_006004 [Aspergillus viridinutans]|uniref:ATP-dependent DNA ligase family profile domain-containing protein n=1 Tax=Aspergillus viridinutans TaxID=75553 RepID=A0A9P3F5F3_ASPVI|nr:uncharacterized protein Aspvir_006004 [Aspergillus viridinutans]GIK01961.1 hypothetical protein Aspvir_006004 [Aspergillus viridinutans]
MFQDADHGAWEDYWIPPSCLDISGADIHIFSKSGRDSIGDRAGIHQAVRDSLQLGTTGCGIEKRCILEGELLVWNSEVGRIEPFYKIRRHVQRAGRQIGTAGDSPIAVGERLMIVLYNVMLLDDLVYAQQSQDKRRDLLEQLVHRIPGQAEVGSRQVIRFSSTDAAESLRKAFSNAIAQRWEGLVLKVVMIPARHSARTQRPTNSRKTTFPALATQPMSLSLNYL